VAPRVGGLEADAEGFDGRVPGAAAEVEERRVDDVLRRRGLPWLRLPDCPIDSWHARNSAVHLEALDAVASLFSE